MRTVCELGMLCLRTGGSYELFSLLDLNSVHLILCLTTYFTLLTFSSPKTLRLYSFLLLYQFPSLLFCFSAFHYCQHQILLWVISETLHLQYFFLHMAEQPVEQPVLLSQLIPCFPWLLQVTTVVFQFGLSFIIWFLNCFLMAWIYPNHLCPLRQILLQFASHTEELKCLFYKIPQGRQQQGKVRNAGCVRGGGLWKSVQQS